MTWLFIHKKKGSLQYLEQIFPVILEVFDLECHDQTFLKVAFVMFVLFS